MTKKNIKIIITIIVFTLLLTFLFPYTGDDWMWGSDMGVSLLKDGFNNYNGRYAGNIIVMILTRSRILRTLVMTLTLIGIINLCLKIVNKEKKELFYIGFMLFLMIPTAVFTQAVVWTSGFTNYAISVALTLIYIYLNKDILIKNNKIDKIIIVCIANHIEHLKEIINKYIKDSSKIDIVEGGSTRNESVINGCNYITNTYGLNDDDVIIIHDSVRPFVNQKIINGNIDNVIKYGAVGTVIKTNDTIFESIDNEIISDIPIRKHMYQAQSPQSFNIKKLLKLYSEISDKEKEEMTDSCKIFTLKGEPVKLVEGSNFNIKITRVGDLAEAKGIINSDYYHGDAGSLVYKMKKKTKKIIKRVLSH